MDEEIFQARALKIVNDLSELHIEYADDGEKNKKYHKVAYFEGDSWTIKVTRIHWWDLITRIKEMWYKLFL